MDISGIDLKYIKAFDISYVTAENMLSRKPENAPPKTQRKIRKRLIAFEDREQEYPPEVIAFVGDDVSDKDYFDFLKACHDFTEKYDADKEQRFYVAANGLSEDAKTALCDILSSGGFTAFKKVGTNAEITFNYYSSYSGTLILHNASDLPEQADFLDFTDGAFENTQGKYLLSGEAFNFSEDKYVPFTVGFTDAEVRVDIFRADEHDFTGTPWDYLQSTAYGIISKNELSGEYLNEREKELLPLLYDISSLFFPINIPQEFADGLSCIKEYISKYGYSKPLKLVELFEKQPPDSKKRDSISKKLLKTLNKQKCEPLWREIFVLIKESQSEYPSQAELCCDTKRLSETRGEIQRLMQVEGYSGTYPDFFKKGSVKRVHLAESYNMDYFVGAEKNVVFCVHCTEETFDGNLSVEFLCGTELLKKNETEGDIYSCTFDAKGRRFFTTVSYNSAVEESSEAQDSLEQKVKIAAKRAELKRLTKEERKAIYGFDMPYFRLFAAIFIFAGGLFGIFMTLGLMLMAVLFALIDGQPQTVPSMITDIPWWFCLVFSWVAFGGAMGIITVLSKRK